MMIRAYVADIAKQKNMLLPSLKVLTVDGNKLGCLGAHLLNISCDDGETSVLLFQTDLDNILNNVPCDCLEIKIRLALDRLKISIDL
jgi:hypothetical protein